MPEATPEFKEQLREAFAELEVGRTFTYQRTFTEGDLSTFCGVTGDYNPYHQDEQFARESWFGERTLPGLLTASMMTHIGGMLGFLATEMSFEYLAAVYPGDTVTCTVTIADKDEEKRRMTGEAEFTNQEDKLVLRARFSGFPGRVRLAR